MTKIYGYPEGPAPWFGVELEAEGGDGWEVAEHLAAEFEMGVHGDGSLNHGAEFVTPPFSVDDFVEGRSKVFERLIDLASELDRRGWKSHDTNTCGLHVHVSREALTDEEWQRFVDIWVSVGEVVAIVARRAPNSYCRRVPPGASIHQLGGERYNEVSFYNAETVEIRRFRGTLHPLAIEAALRLVHTIMVMAKHCYPANPLAFFQCSRDFGHENLARYIAERVNRFVARPDRYPTPDEDVVRALVTFFPDVELDKRALP